MTASLPVPHEPTPDDPDASVARADDGEVVDFSAGPRGGSRSSAAPGGGATARGKKPAKPRAPRSRTPEVAPDPGPPPPLPPSDDIVVPPRPDLPRRDSGDDIVVPPKPPLPAASAGEAGSPLEAAPPSDVEIETDLEVIADTDAALDEMLAPDDLAEADAEVEAVPDPDADAEAEAEAEAETIVEPDASDDDAMAVADPDTDTGLDELLAPDADGVTGADVETESMAVLADVFFGTRTLSEVDEETAALVLRGVSKRFGDTPAVEAIDLTVPAGSFYGLVGPNGAGKTTTLSMIAGLLSPDRGVIRVGGVEAASDPRGAKRLMGVLPDRLRTFDRLTGRQLLYYYGVLRGLKRSVVESRTADLARAFDLTDALGRVVSDYSAGMTKKIMLAGAMIHSPRVLVLDEPFEAVDPVSSAVILDILSAYVEHGGTVILSSHGMDLVERVCTRVAVIVAGQVLAEGTVEEVRGELTLEQRFIELAGGLGDVEGLEWLHTFSD